MLLVSRKVFILLLRLKRLFSGMVVSCNVYARAGVDSGHLVSTEQAGQCHCAALCDMSHRHTDTRRCVTCHTDITTPRWTPQLLVFKPSMESVNVNIRNFVRSKIDVIVKIQILLPRRGDTITSIT